MPLVNLRIAAAPDRELAARAAWMHRHTVEQLGKQPDLIAIAVDFVDPAHLVRGRARARRQRQAQLRARDQGHRRTNTKAEKARFIAAVFASFEQLFGPLHERATSTCTTRARRATGMAGVRRSGAISDSRRDAALSASLARRGASSYHPRRARIEGPFEEGSLSDRSDYTVPRASRHPARTLDMALFLLRLRGGGGRCGADGRSAGTQRALQAALAPREGGAFHVQHLPFPAGVRLLGGLRLAGVARLLLSRRFEHDGLGVARADAYANWVAAVLPRLLACLAPAAGDAADRPDQHADGRGDRPVCAPDPDRAGAASALRRRDREEQLRLVRFHGAGVSRQAIWGMLALSATLLAGLWIRSAGAGRGAALGARRAVALRAWDARRTWPDTDAEQGQALREEARGNWRVFSLSLLAGAAMLALIGLSDDEVDLARRLGLPALLLFALGSWTVFGGFVLTYLPLSRRWIGLATWLPPLLFVAFCVLGDALRGAARPGSGRAAAHRGGARDLVERFRRWVAQVPPEIRSTWLPRWVGPAAQPSGPASCWPRSKTMRAPCGWPTLCRRPVRDQQHLRRQPGRDGVRCRCRAVPGHRSLRGRAGCRIDEFARALPVGTARGLSRARLPGAGGRPHALSGSVHPLRARAAKPGVARRPLTGPGGGLGG